MELSLGLCDDCWLWKSDINKIISTKAAYRFLAPSSSGSVAQGDRWRCLWKLLLLPQIKNVLLKAFAPLLPFVDRLA